MQMSFLNFSNAFEHFLKYNFIVQRFHSTAFLPFDALRKSGLRCRRVSVCLSVTFLYNQTAEDIVKLYFFLGPVAPSF